MKWMLSTGVLLFALFTYTLSFAEGSMEKHKDEIDLTRAAIKVQKKQIVAKNMHLTPAEEEKFWPLYRSYQERMDSVSEQRAKIITDYADALNNKNLNDKTAGKILDDFFAHESAKLTYKRSMATKLKKVLPPKKVALFIQIDNKLDAIINYELARQIPLMR